MRLFCVVVLLLMPTFVRAQPAGLDTCLKKLDGDGRYAPLAARFRPGAASKIQVPAGSDPNLPTNKEKPLLNNWIAARTTCVESAEREGNADYRPPLTAYAIDAERKVLAAAHELYDQKMTFDEFNRRREAIDVEKQSRVAALSRRIQDQAAAHEADQRSREIQQMKKDLDDAELQASQAQQQVSELTARRATRSQRSYSPPPPVPAPVAPYYYRNCARAGGRIVCPR